MSNVFTKDRLRSLVERVERLEEDKAALATDISSVYAEAKSEGFDIKLMREIIKERRIDAKALSERNAILDLYRAALGILEGTPLGAAAMARLHDEVSHASA